MTEQQKQETNTAWIDSNKQLPEEHDPVFVWRGWVDIAVLGKAGRWYSTFDANQIYNVTHWYPMLTAP